MNEIENKINNLYIKIGELEEKIKNLEQNKNKNQKSDNININYNYNDDIEKLKQALEELKKAHDQTVINVSNNKEQIDLILGRLNDIINGYKTGDEHLQKEIDEIKKKLSQINYQIDLLLKLPKGTGSGNTDLSAINK